MGPSCKLSHAVGASSLEPKEVAVEGVTEMISGGIRETAQRGTLRNPTFGALKRDLIERVYIPKDPKKLNSLDEEMVATMLTISGSGSFWRARTSTSTSN